MGARLERTRRALTVTRVARRSGLLRVLRELGVFGERPATRVGAREFRQALEELGTTFIKLGQLLSSRPDLLPDVYIDELAKLVDQVPPVQFAEIKQAIDEDLPGDVFASIDEQPLATASIAQIHAALLKNGREVIVKVRRPGIVEQVELDLALLRRTAALFEKRSERAQLLQARALADELEVLPAGRARLHRGSKQRGARRRVAGGVRRRGRPAGDPPLRDRALHADPHRGNVLLLEDGRLGLVDFGLLGRLDDDTRRNLALLLLAVAQNRADDVADLILSLSRTTLASDEAGFLHDLRRKLPRYHWRPLSGIRAGEALADLQRISFEFGISLPTSFALVGKTLSQADSIARVLYPELDPIQLMEEDSLEVMLREAERRLEPNQFFAWLYTQLEPLARMPRHVGQLLTKLETGTFKVGVAPTDLADAEGVVRSVANRIGGAMIVSALLVASALLARVHDLRWFAFAGFCASFVLGTYMLWKIIRTPGEL